MRHVRPEVGSKSTLRSRQLDPEPVAGWSCRRGNSVLSQNITDFSVSMTREFVSMLKSWTFATPASHGIGLYLAKRLLKTTNLPVVATARSNLEDVKQELLADTNADAERLKVLPLDVTGTSNSLPCILPTVQSLLSIPHT